MPHLRFKENERPIVAQLFGSKPENFYTCAQLAVELGFDGIDINMGCPDKSVEKQGAGAMLINNPKLAQEIIRETKKGGDKLPVSVKTRLGYNKIITKEWVSYLLESETAAIIIHGRTRKEVSSVPAHWDEIGVAKEIAKNAKTLIIGNGDVVDLNDAKKKARDYNLDGIMVGRGIFTNPWFFSDEGGPVFSGSDSFKKTPEQRIELMLEHLDNFEKLWGSNGKFDTMKKFFKVYISGFDGAKELRTKLMVVKNKQEVVDILAKTM